MMTPEQILEMIDDLILTYNCYEQRIVDNSCCTSPAYYVREEARIQKEHMEHLAMREQLAEMITSTKETR